MKVHIRSVYLCLVWMFALLVGTTLSRADTRESWQVTPFEIDETRLPVIQVTLHSRNKPDQARSFRFLLDTGAFMCVLDTSIPEEFFWNDLVPTIRLHDAQGVGSEVPSVFIKRLVIAGMTRDTIPATRMDLKNSFLGCCQDQPIDGILGMSFLRGTRFIFNPSKKWIEWWNTPTRGVGMSISYLEDGRPCVRLRVEKADVLCGLDTGGAVGILLPAALKPGVKGKVASVGGAVSASTSNVTTCKVERIDAADRAWRNVDVDFQEGMEFGLIGQEIWSAAPACFDFIRNSLILTQKDDGSLPILSPAPSLPIIWDRQSTPPKLVVVVVRPGSTFEKAGLKQGDQILRADGVGGEGLKRKTLIESLAREDCHSWTVQRGDREIQVAFN